MTAQFDPMIAAPDLMKTWLRTSMAAASMPEAMRRDLRELGLLSFLRARLNLSPGCRD
jgi:hypothetical protein